jgi:nucleoside-diphosphate-sugar epimerase
MVRGDEEGIDKLRSYGEVVAADLADFDQIKSLCRGIDTVLHLAADPNPQALWESLLPTNIIGTYHVMMAASEAKCRRVIYASSIHAVSGYPPDMQVKSGDPVNPGDLYGVSKCFGEALGRYLAEQQGLSVICLRIGAVQPLAAARNPDAVAMLDAFVSQRDMHQLIERCIADETLQWAIFNALSNNRFNRLDITDARQLIGYEPRDDATRENPSLRALHLRTAISTHSETDSRKRTKRKRGSHHP